MYMYMYMYVCMYGTITLLASFFAHISRIR